MKKITLLTFLLIALIGCSNDGADATLNETFDAVGSWRVGDDADAMGAVIDGVYRFDIKQESGSFWTTAGSTFANGVYEVDVVQRTGSVDAGYGMMFRVDDREDQSDAFYLFEVSADGHVWIGRCLQGCSEQKILVNNWWFESPAVNKGLDQTNRLRVYAEYGNLIFYVNDQEVGRVTDYTLIEGDIGLYVETLGTGGVQVEFDNFTINPISQ